MTHEATSGDLKVHASQLYHLVAKYHSDEKRAYKALQEALEQTENKQKVLKELLHEKKDNLDKLVLVLEDYRVKLGEKPLPNLRST